MKQIPILFSTPMVQAILDGRKTQTRRVVKPQPIRGIENVKENIFFDPHNSGIKRKAFLCPYGYPGDLLWVRETHYAFGHWIEVEKDGKTSMHFVDETKLHGYDYGFFDNKPNNIALKRIMGTCHLYKRPSIFMPKEACRIWLEVVSVKVERLQDISENDAKSEGAFDMNSGINGITMHKAGFEDLWKYINGTESWDVNPWVWVVEFKRIKKQTL